MRTQHEDRIRSLAAALAPALTPQAHQDILAYVDAGEWALALSDLRDIAILENASDHRAEAEAIAGAMGIALHLDTAAG
jgi:hypothetical protein